MECEEIDRVNKTKILGKIISDNLKWDACVVRKASSIKTCGCLSEKELVRVYEGLVRSVCEHACMPGMVNSPAKTSN